MNMQEFIRATSPEQREALAAKVEISSKYLFQISGGHRKPSVKLARRLVEADSRLTLSELRPDIWGALASD